MNGDIKMVNNNIVITRGRTTKHFYVFIGGSPIDRLCRPKGFPHGI